MIINLKYPVFTVFSFLLLTACSSDSTEEPAAGSEVRFVVSDSTRSSIVTDETIHKAPFLVFGEMMFYDSNSTNPSSSSTHTQIFDVDGTKVAYNESAGLWEYANTQYWLPKHIFSFAALYPAGNTDISDINYEAATGRLSFNYTYPSDYTKAVDILTAVHRREYTYGATNPVAFNFGHTLARLNFTVKVEPAVQGSVEIRQLTLRNIGMSSTYTIAPAPLSFGDDYIDGVWSQPENRNEVLFDLTQSVTVSSGETYSFFPSGTNPLMVIPQRISENLEVYIEYVINGETFTGTAKLFTTTVTSHNGVWTAGNSYSYTFSIGATEFILYGEPDVKPWKEESGGNYIITN